MLATLAATDFFMRRLACLGLVLNRSVRTLADTLQNLLLKGRTKKERKKERKKDRLFSQHVSWGNYSIQTNF